MKKGVLRIQEDGHVAFFCPGCKSHHRVRVPPHPNAWGFNGDYEHPTFTPSVLVRGFQDITDDEHAALMRSERIERRALVCHSFITDGKIQFLNDCTHALAGQTVALTLMGEK